MSSGKMHANEVHVDLSLVSELIAVQFPQWASLPLQSFVSAGTSNAIYRLGDDMVVRLPRTPSSATQVAKEQRWLPQLAPLLPLTIPLILAHGVPTDSYPCPWSIYQWIEGDNAVIERLTDPFHAAATLGQFVSAMQKIEITDGPLAGAHNFFRGTPLRIHDEDIRIALQSLDGIIDISAATLSWEAALQAPEWKGRPSWIHGDLHVGNMLAKDGRLSAVIDFGGLGMGDPACDVMAAWTYLPAKTRHIFREAIGADDATWVRGRGWALYLGVIALPYYQFSNPALAEIARRAINEVLTDHN